MPDALDEVHAALDRCWQALDALPRPPSAEWWELFRTAVAEIATNIIRHAYPPGAPRGVLRVRLALQPDALEAWLTDDGVEWTPVGTPAEIDPLSLPENGLGLIIARAAVDDLHYERDAEAGKNVWHLTKHFPEAA